jgi:hypothetical protein
MRVSWHVCILYIECTRCIINIQYIYILCVCVCRFGSAKECQSYYENRWVLRDVPDICESNDKKEQTHYN